MIHYQLAATLGNILDTFKYSWIGCTWCVSVWVSKISNILSCLLNSGCCTRLSSWMFLARNRPDAGQMELQKTWYKTFCQACHGLCSCLFSGMCKGSCFMADQIICQRKHETLQKPLLKSQTNLDKKTRRHGLPGVRTFKNIDCKLGRFHKKGNKILPRVPWVRIPSEWRYQVDQDPEEEQ